METEKTVRVNTVQFNKFKAFASFQLTLSDTNILVGPNNSGKSTIIGAFRALSIALKVARSKSPERVDIGRRRLLGYWVSSESLPISLKNVHTDYEDVDSSVAFTLSNRNVLKLEFPVDGGCVLIANAQGVPVTTVGQFRKAFPVSLSVVPVLGPIEDSEILREKSTVTAGLSTHRASRHFRSYWYHYSEDFDEFASLINRTWPGMEISRPEIADHLARELAMFCLDDRMTRELYWVGFGFQIWCQLLTHLSRSRSASLVVIDEPEIYLHPDVQRQLLGIIRDLGPDVLMATHSTEIMAEADPGEIILVDKKKRHGQRLRDVEGVQRALDAVGSIQNIALSTLAKNRRLLFVEGDEDFRIIRRFAKKLGFDQLGTGVGITPLQSGGFGSWQRIATLASGIADALGASLMIGAVYDRDYFCQEEIVSIESNLKGSLALSKVLARKEMENYLLVPEAIDRAIRRVILEKESRTGEDSVIPDTLKLIGDITDDFKDDVCSQITAKRVAFLKQSHRDPADITKETLKSFSKQWAVMDRRLLIVPGKEVLRCLRDRVQAISGVTLTLARIIDAMKKEEIPMDLVDLIKEIDNYRSLK
jgi:energy-coupling factor transporter ATP-binding protein EcfA2